MEMNAGQKLMYDAYMKMDKEDIVAKLIKCQEEHCDMRAYFNQLEAGTTIMELNDVVDYFNSRHEYAMAEKMKGNIGYLHHGVYLGKKYSGHVK